MPNRRLTKDEAAVADKLLAETKAAIEEAAGGDPILLFALRRRLFIRLMYWERGTPAQRTKLKAEKWKAQDGLCAICGASLTQKGSELDRADPVSSTLAIHEAWQRA